jgi:hypothetical protein
MLGGVEGHQDPNRSTVGFGEFPGVGLSFMKPGEIREMVSDE